MDKHIPLIEKRVKREKQPGWITDKKNNRNSYKFWRNRSTKLIRAAKQKCYIQSIEQNKHNPGIISEISDELSHKPKKTVTTNLCIRVN